MSDLPRVQLSSVGLIALTDETREALTEVGVSEEQAFGQTEIWGRSILTLKKFVLKVPADQAPTCYRKEFDPESDLCAGCTWMPSCWQSSPDYLEALKSGKAKPPPGVPKHVVEKRMGSFEHNRKRLPPPKRKKKLPPKKQKIRRPPPRRSK